MKLHYTIADLAKLTNLDERQLRNLQKNHGWKKTKNKRGLLLIDIRDVFQAITSLNDDETMWRIRKTKADALKAEQSLAENEKKIREDESQKTEARLSIIMEPLRREISKARQQKYSDILPEIQECISNTIKQFESQIAPQTVQTGA